MIIIALDDEEGARRMLERAIRRAEPNGEVYIFETGEETLAFAEQHTVDVAFLDVMMPNIDGLEVAKRLKCTNPNVNVIFTTGTPVFTIDAMKLNSSGYILKPASVEDIRSELDNLRNPIGQPKGSKSIRAKAFGAFELYVNGAAVAFGNARAREMLAYLIDREGAVVTRKEIAEVLFGDPACTRATQNEISQIVTDLKKSLKDADAGKLLVQKLTGYAVNTEVFDCDAYDYLKGRPDAINRFRGEYMTGYSWAEERTDRFFH